MLLYRQVLFSIKLDPFFDIENPPNPKTGWGIFYLRPSRYRQNHFSIEAIPVVFHLNISFQLGNRSHS